LTSREKTNQRGAQFDFYMDLLGHDVLNSNQAVLGYLELICSNPATDKKSKAFAEKAITHARTSTILVENVKRLISTKDMDPADLKPVNLVDVVDQAQQELVRFYPGKSLRLEMSNRPRNAYVLGNNYAADLILNVFVIAARLNLGDDIRMKMSFSQDDFHGKPVWTLRIEDANAQLPPFLDGGGVSATYAQDVSRAVKAAGMLFAKMIAGNLGGDFEAHAIHHEPRTKGAVFTVALRKAEKP
jgi:light-regulated signal transduction histidine kinase (bacteriophytochrome)